MQSSAATAINKRKVACDKYYTPASLAEFHIRHFCDIIGEFEPSTGPDGRYGNFYEPFSGKGAYLKAFEKHPLNAGRKMYDTEIDNGTDFFKNDQNIPCEVISSVITNPPYSKLTEIFKRLINLKFLDISLLLGTMNLTPSRLTLMKKSGYKLVGLHFTRVRGWFSYSVIATWTMRQGEIPCKVTSDCSWHLQDDTSVPVSNTV